MLHQGGEQGPDHQQARQQHPQRRLPATAAPVPQPAPQSQPGPLARCADPEAPAAPAADHPAREAPVGLHRPAAAAWTRHLPVGSVASDQLQRGPRRPLRERTADQPFEILKPEAGAHRAIQQAPVPPAAGRLPPVGRHHPRRRIALGIPLPSLLTVPRLPGLPSASPASGGAASGIAIAGIPLRMTAAIVSAPRPRIRAVPPPAAGTPDPAVPRRRGARSRRCPAPDASG